MSNRDLTPAERIGWDSLLCAALLSLCVLVAYAVRFAQPGCPETGGHRAAAEVR